MQGHGAWNRQPDIAASVRLTPSPLPMGPNRFARESVFLCLLALSLLGSIPARGQGSSAGAAATPSSTTKQASPPASHPPLPNLSAQPDTPRGALLGYLRAARAGNYEEAAHFLDMSDLPEETSASEGPRLARHLKIVLDQKLWFRDIEDISDLPAGDPNDNLPEDRDRIGTFETKHGPVEVRLKRVAGENGELTWKFGPTLVAHIDDLYDEFGLGLFGDYLPKWSIEIRFLKVEAWQWIGLVICALIGYFAAHLLTGRIYAFARRRQPSDSETTEVELLKAIVLPVRLSVAVILFASLSIGLLRLSVPARSFLVWLVQLTAIVLVMWALFKLTDFVTAKARNRLEAEGRRSGIGVVILGRRLAKVLIGLLTFIVILQLAGYNASGLLTGVGVAGIGISLAAQKTIANLFGGVSLSMDQPIRVGDLCRFGDVGSMNRNVA